MKTVVRTLCIALALAAVGLLAGCEQEGAPQGKAQITCPITGGAISKEVFADHEGKRVYFCCPDCIEKFTKEPQKYVKKLEDEGISLAKTPRKGG